MPLRWRLAGAFGLLITGYLFAEWQSKPSPAVSADFDVSPTRVAPGEPVTLTWKTVNAESVTIEPGIGKTTHSGRISVVPTASGYFSLRARNRNTGQGRSIQVVVGPPSEPSRCLR